MALEAKFPGRVHRVVAPARASQFPLLVWARDGSDTATTYEGGHGKPLLGLTVYGKGANGHAEADEMMTEALAVLRNASMLAAEPDDPIDDYDVEPQTYSVDVSVMLRTL